MGGLGAGQGQSLGGAGLLRPWSVRSGLRPAVEGEGARLRDLGPPREPPSCPPRPARTPSQSAHPCAALLRGELAPAARGVPPSLSRLLRSFSLSVGVSDLWFLWTPPSGQVGPRPWGASWWTQAPPASRPSAQGAPGVTGPRSPHWAAGSGRPPPPHPLFPRTPLPATLPPSSGCLPRCHPAGSPRQSLRPGTCLGPWGSLRRRENGCFTLTYSFLLFWTFSLTQGLTTAS